VGLDSQVSPSAAQLYGIFVEKDSLTCETEQTLDLIALTFMMANKLKDILLLECHQKLVRTGMANTKHELRSEKPDYSRG